MVRYQIIGQNTLKGRVKTPGNKNSVLPLLAATLLVQGKSIIKNVPRIRDVPVMLSILEILGVKSLFLDESTLSLDSSNVINKPIPSELTAKLRASILVLGPLLSLFGEAKLGFPGGDVIGKRAVGSHLDGLRKFGIDFGITQDGISGKKNRSEIKENKEILIFMDEASVTGTENILMYAAKFNGKTIIENAACEPHVTDLCTMLEKMGVAIKGKGSNRLEIEGTLKPKDIEVKVGADFMDAGTFAMVAAITKSEITIENICEPEMRSTLLYLERFGVRYKWEEKNELIIIPSDLVVESEGIGIRQKFQTRPWPGFSPDLMSPLVVLATQTKGTVLLNDWMYETRFFFTDKLVTMGANITLCDPHRIIVAGPTKLYGRHLSSPDIRAGMAFVLAALVAEGETTVDQAELIERGCEDPVERLTKIGAKIIREGE